MGTSFGHNFRKLTDFKGQFEQFNGLERTSAINSRTLTIFYMKSAEICGHQRTLTVFSPPPLAQENIFRLAQQECLLCVQEEKRLLAQEADLLLLQEEARPPEQ